MRSMTNWSKAVALVALVMLVGCGGGSNRRRDDDRDDDRPARRNYGGGPRNGEELDAAKKRAEDGAKQVADNVSGRARGGSGGYNKGVVLEFWPKEGVNPYRGRTVDANDDGDPDISPEGWDVRQHDKDIIVVRHFHSRSATVIDEWELYLSEEMGHDMITIGGTGKDDDDARTVVRYDERDLPEWARNVAGGDRAYVFDLPEDVSESMRDMDLPLEMRKVRMNGHSFGEDGEDNEGEGDDSYLHFTRHSGDPTRSASVFVSADPNVRFTCRNADDEGGASLGLVILDEEDERPRDREMPGPPRSNRVSE